MVVKNLGILVLWMNAVSLLEEFITLYSCLEIYLTSVVWTCHTFENNFGTNPKFPNYFKESCRYSSNEQLSFRYFVNIALVRERYYQNSPAVLTASFCTGQISHQQHKG